MNFLLGFCCVDSPLSYSQSFFVLHSSFSLSSLSSFQADFVLVLLSLLRDCVCVCLCIKGQTEIARLTFEKPRQENCLTGSKNVVYSIFDLYLILFSIPRNLSLKLAFPCGRVSFRMSLGLPRKSAVRLVLNLLWKRAASCGIEASIFLL